MSTLWHAATVAVAALLTLGAAAVYAQDGAAGTTKEDGVSVIAKANQRI